MALRRQDLREELVAIIAAGRELSPEHDHLLADIFLDLLGRSPRRTPLPARAGERLRQALAGMRRVRGPALAACLALAVLAYSLFLFRAASLDPRFDRHTVVPRTFDPDRSYGQPGWWNGGVSPQSPQPPGSATLPNV